MSVPETTRLYRYNVESLKIIFPTEGIHYEIDKKLILSLFIERNYDELHFPIMRLDLSLATDLYYKILHNKISVKFQIRLQKYTFDPQNSKAGIKKDVFNDTFILAIDENTPFLDKSAFDAAMVLSSDTTTKGSIPVTVGGNNFSFYLYKEHDLTYSSYIINSILSSDNMSNTIAFMLASTGFTRTLMSPLDNKSTYSQIIIPPITFLGNLIYLDQQYGFYKKGSVIFFDLPCLYILNRTPTCTAFRKGEYKKTVFNIKDSLDPGQFNVGSYDDESQSTTFINVNFSNVSMSSVNTVKDYIDGVHRVIINPTDATISKKKSTSTYRGDGTYKVMYNKYDNSYLDSAELAEIQSNDNVVQLGFNNLDMDSITPNKEFVLKFDDSSIQKKVGGSYRLSKSVMVLQNKGDYYDISGMGIFKK